jgi:hypothetical protein
MACTGIERRYLCSYIIQAFPAKSITRQHNSACPGFVILV